MYHVLRRLGELWVRAQVSRQGHYSVERLALLEHYCATVSPLRVAFVLLTTPLPVLVLMCSIEMVPMKSPSEGWAANYVFWIKTGVAVIILCESMMRQAQHMVPELPLSSRQRFVISVGTAIGYVAPLVWIASQWAFPIPFTLVVGAAPCSFVFLALGALVIGPRVFVESSLLRKKSLQIANIASLEMLLLILYPSYNAAFLSMGSCARAVFLLILPVTKIVHKNALAYSSSYWPDLVPVTAVFSIELFNALYVASFMQNSGSPLVTAIVVAIDTGHMVLVLRGLFRRMRAIKRVQRNLTERKTGSMPSRNASKKLNTLATVRSLCFQPEMLDAEGLRSIRLTDNRSSKIEIPSEAVETIRHLGSLGLYACGQTGTIPIPDRNLITSIVPARKVVPRPSVAALTPELKTQFVHETLSLLFEYEYVILAEYIECVVPCIYVVYMSWLHLLPNAQFFPFLQRTSASQFAQAMQTVMWYAALEIALFLVMQAVAHRRLSYPPLYQLAFTLESHAAVVRAQLLNGVLLVFESALVHLGADFSFRFAWLHAA